VARTKLNLSPLPDVCGKRRHYALREATKALHLIKAKHYDDGRYGHLRIYHCDQCGALHVGHDINARTES
jgi:hypothetical protein